MSIVLRVLGWLCVAGGVAAAVALAVLDFRLRAFRHSEVALWRYWITPFRWQEELYHGQGPQLVRHIWRAMGLMLGLTLGGALLLTLAG